MGNAQTVQTLTFDGTPLPGMTVNTPEGRRVFTAWDDAKCGVARVRRLKPRERPPLAAAGAGADADADAGADTDADTDAGSAAQADAHTTVELSLVSISRYSRKPFFCAQEEACFFWVAKRARALYRRAEEEEEKEEEEEGGAEPAAKVSEADLDDLLLKHDSYLLGFLQAATKYKGAAAMWSELDVEAVAHKVLASLKYRVARGVLQMRTWPPRRAVQHRLPGGLFGTGKQRGRPVLWIMTSVCDWANVDLDTAEKSELQLQERLSEELTASGHRNLISCVLLDGVCQTMLQYQAIFTLYGDISDKYYPGRVHKILLLNGNAFVTGTYNLAVKPFMDEDTQKLVRIFEKGAATLAGLRKYIEDENIPRLYGGSAPGSGPDDVLLESELFPEGVNAAAQALKARCLRDLEEEGGGGGGGDDDGDLKKEAGDEKE
jgi:hypothetical protein